MHNLYHHQCHFKIHIKHSENVHTPMVFILGFSEDCSYHTRVSTLIDDDDVELNVLVTNVCAWFNVALCSQKP